MEVTEAASGHDALNMIEDGRAFDIALIDAVMPDMNGMALARKLKERGDREISIILLNPFGLSKAENPSLSGVLTKPVKPLQLHNLLVDLSSLPSDGQMGKEIARRLTVEKRSHSLRILLAEDNAVNQKVALGMLRRLGYKADVAGNGIEVLRALERQHYDVVLMDVQMPEMDGYEATCCIRKRESSEKQPWIIAMTAYALEGDKEECFKAGMNEFISKPIKITELQEALDRQSEIINRSSMIEENAL
jgi:CheY-like chemotaxis protein